MLVNKLLTNADDALHISTYQAKLISTKKH